MPLASTLSALFLLSSTSLAGEQRPHKLELHVQDVSGEPIGHATLRFAVEGDMFHGVNDVIGRASYTHLYTEQNEELVLRKGQVYAIEVTADGYSSLQTTVRLDRRNTRVVYTLLEEGVPAAAP